MVAVLSASVTNISALPSGKGCKYTGQAVRALPIRIISVGKKRSQGVQLVADEYIQRLKLYCSVEDVHIKNNPKNASDWRAQVDHEDSAVMELIKSDDWVVLLDERGKDIGSKQMAELVGDAGNTVCITSWSFKTIILCWWTLWTWKTIARTSKHFYQVVFDGIKSSNCFTCARRTTLQVMDHSERTELSSLAFLLLICKMPQ